ncbi:hypothetical protein ACOME3_005381 [Neoechinorhynchus agilis]
MQRLQPSIVDFPTKDITGYATDSAIYKSLCRSEGPVLKAMNKSVRFAPLRKPMFSKKLSDVHALEGTEVVLDCLAECDYDTSFVWLHNNQPISNRIENGQDANKFWLRINRVTMQDAGTYSIKVSCNGGSISCSCRLHITEVARSSSSTRSVLASRSAPYFIQSLEVHHKPTERRAIIECKVNCEQDATMQWYKNNEVIVPDNRKYVAMFNRTSRSFSLSINDLNQADAGIYGIRVWDRNGEIGSATSITQGKKRIIAGGGVVPKV